MPEKIILLLLFNYNPTKVICNLLQITAGRYGVDKVAIGLKSEWCKRLPLERLK